MGRSVTQTVEVDVCLSEFETDALIEELASRDFEPEYARRFMNAYVALLIGDFDGAREEISAALSPKERGACEARVSIARTILNSRQRRAA